MPPRATAPTATKAPAQAKGTDLNHSSVVARRRRRREGRAALAPLARAGVGARPAPDGVPRGVGVWTPPPSPRRAAPPVRRHVVHRRALRTEHGLVPRGPRVRARAGRRLPRFWTPPPPSAAAPAHFATTRTRSGRTGTGTETGFLRRATRSSPRSRRRRSPGCARQRTTAATPPPARSRPFSRGTPGTPRCSPGRRAPRWRRRTRRCSGRSSRAATRFSTNPNLAPKRFHPRADAKKRPRVFPVPRARRRSKRALALARERPTRRDPDAGEAFVARKRRRRRSPSRPRSRPPTRSVARATRRASRGNPRGPAARPPRLVSFLRLLCDALEAFAFRAEAKDRIQRRLVGDASARRLFAALRSKLLFVARRRGAQKHRRDPRGPGAPAARRCRGRRGAETRGCLLGEARPRGAAARRRRRGRVFPGRSGSVSARGARSRERAEARSARAARALSPR